MIKKWIAIALSAALLAGCSASPSSQAASSGVGSSDAAGPAAEPVYSYVDPHPEMVFAKLPSGEVTYAEYRLYIDMNQMLEQEAARRNLALTRMLEKDLPGMGITIDETDFDQVAGQQLLNAYMQQGYAEAMDKMKTLLAIDETALFEAVKEDFRPQYLLNLMYTNELAKAEKNHPVSEAAASAAPAPSETSAAPDASSVAPPTAEELAAQAAQERQAAIEAEAGAIMDAYYADFESRCKLEDNELLAVLDDEKLDYTEAERHYIDYAGMAGRLNQLTAIQAGEASLRELDAKGKTPDYDAFLTEKFAPYVESVRASEDALPQLDGYLVKLGATRDDFIKALERPMWLNSISYDFSQMILEEYAALEESADKPTQEAYYTQRITALLEGAELLNETGK